MPAQARVGDNANIPSDGHGSPCCHHSCTGPGTEGSPNVNVNGMPALRLGDPGVHSSCCGANTWNVMMASTTVFINGKGAARLGDQTQHCGGVGQLIQGSPNVNTGG